jgi:hypothetical protein
VQLGRKVIGGPRSSASLDKYARNLFGSHPGRMFRAECFQYIEIKFAAVIGIQFNIVESGIIVR